MFRSRGRHRPFVGVGALDDLRFEVILSSLVDQGVFTHLNQLTNLNYNSDDISYIKKDDDDDD